MLNDQVSYATDTVADVWTTPTITLEHVDFGLTSERPRVKSGASKAGRRTQGRWFKGLEKCAGPITHEFSPAAIPILLSQAIGAVDKTGAGPYQRVYTCGPLVETQTTSIQGTTQDAGGVVNPMNFRGGQIAKWGLSIKNDASPVKWSAEWVAQHLLNTGDGDSVPGLFSASYPSLWSPFTGLHAVLTLNSALFEFDSLEFAADNGLQTGKYTARSTTPWQAKRSKESGNRSITAVVTSDVWDITAMNRAFAGTEVPFSLALTNGAASFTIAGNVACEPYSLTPAKQGDSAKQGLSLEFTSLTNDATAFTATLINADALP